MKRILKHKTIILISLLFITAAFLRLYKIADYMTFLGDEGRDVLVVYEILHGNPTLLGPTASVGGFFLGPIYYYFMVPFLWLFNYNPVGPAVMVALFGIATVVLVYKVGKEYFGKNAGFIAASLFAISPIIISYSRSSWNPNLMPFFSLLLLYVLQKAVAKSSWKLFIVVGFLFGITLQLHYLTLFLGVIIVLYVIIMAIYNQKEKRLIKAIIKTIIKQGGFIFGGFIIGFSPFLAFEILHNFVNIKSIFNFIFESKDTGVNNQFFPVINDVFFRIFARLITKFPPPEQISVKESVIFIDFYVGKIDIKIFYWFIFSFSLILVSIGYFIKQLLKAYVEKKKEFSRFLLCFLWLFIGVILFGFYKKPIYDYYFGFMFALPFLLVGNLFSKIPKRIIFVILVTYLSSLLFVFNDTYPLKSLGLEGIKIIYKIFLILPIIFVIFYALSIRKTSIKNIFIVLLSSFIFYIIVILNATGIPFRTEPNRQVAQVEKIARFVENKTNSKPFNFALITGGNSDHAYRFFFKTWNRDPRVIKNVIEDPKRESVTDQLLIVCEMPCSPLGNSLWEVAGFGRAEIAGQWNVSVVQVFKLVPYTEK